VIKPTYSEVSIIDCNNKKFTLDDKKGIQSDLGSEYSGANEYSIYGWAKWSESNNNNKDLI